MKAALHKSRLAESKTLRNQIRALKSQGFSYCDIGEMIQRDGKPIGKANAQRWARPQLGECAACLRPLKTK